VNIDFRECPHCGGYGVRDNGANCKTCGGSGRGGLLGQGQIGSGEIMFDRDTGRHVTAAEMVAMAQKMDEARKSPGLFQNP
jgi:DnaJ-class molecular chaperone